MANIERATLTFTEKLLGGGRSEITFKVSYVARFSAAEVGRTFSESFNLIERDITSDDDVLARNLARLDFVPDVASPQLVSRELSA